MILSFFFSHSSNSCFIFCRNLYTHFVHEMIVEPGTKASAGSQADDHVSLLLPLNHAILFKGGGVRINVIFWITYTHVFTGLTAQKCLHLLLQFLDLKCFTFDLWNMSSWTCYIGLKKLSKLIPMSIYKEFQTVQYREI